jgi:psiF repeat
VKALLAIVLASAVAFAASPASAADNPQQERMKTCNAKAGEKKGDERKKFMSECLSAEKKTHDSKMSECNTKSKGMKADERNKFMSECMKKAA